MKLTHYIYALLTVTGLSGCGDFLEQYSQDTDYVKTWTDLNELLLGDCYTPVNNTSSFFNYSNKGMFLHFLADELEEQTSSLGGTQGFDTHEYSYGYRTWAQRTGTNENYTGFYTENQAWTQMYKYINVANNIIASADDVPQVTDEEKAGVNYVKGQAHFLRAWYLFWLTNVYGQPYSPSTASTELGVPVKTTKEVVDIKYQRNTVQECYDQILSDLNAAETEYKAVGSRISRKSIYRADSVSVLLLTSRVYLYMQNWQKAAEYARRVIAAHPQLQDLNGDAEAFMTVDNPETIFSMGGDDITADMDCNIKQMRVSKSLYDSYGDNDLRKSKWFWKYGNFQGLTKQPSVNTSTHNDKTESGYYFYNYENFSDKRSISSLFWLRSGEAYLNLAEAEAYMGNDEVARDAVNTLRKARFYKGAAEAKLTSSGNALISDIRNERKLDLACEGYRWFDLRRYRVCTVQPEKVALTHYYLYYQDRNSENLVEIRKFVLTEDDPSWTLPIPQEVIDFNVGMKNNGNPFREYEIVTTAD